MLPSAGETTPGTTGLKNSSKYICYCNTVMQCLSQMPPVKEFFINNIGTTGGGVTQSFRLIMQMLWSGRYKSLSVEVLREKIGRMNAQFSNHEHQDAQEFFTVLLDIVHDEMKSDRAVNDDEEVLSPQEAMEKFLEGKSSIISDAFFGQTRSAIVCDECGCRSANREADFAVFTTWIVPLPDEGIHDLKVH